MGFLEAVKALGQMEAGTTTGKHQAGEEDSFGDIADFLELPMPLSQNQKGKVIRVWCKSSNITQCLADVTLPLDILGIERMDCEDYGAGGDEPNREKIKRKILYRSPVGSNVTWSYTPLYKLGKSKKNRKAVLESLIGEYGKWCDNKKTRFFKLRKNVLQAFEDEGTYSAGSTDRLIRDLEKKVETLVDLWCETDDSTILVFGFSSPSGEFMWPGDIPRYRKYFKTKLQPETPLKSKSQHHKLTANEQWACASCSHKMDREAPFTNVSEIFSFATFDKPGFLPGASKLGSTPATLRKVWPLCRSCFGFLNRGRSYIDDCYLRGDIVLGLNLFVIPELIFSNTHLLQADEHTRHFLRKGISMEKRLFNYLAKQGDFLVYHFVFWEKNKAQELVHLMIEDVPPTRLKKLESTWRESSEAYPFSSKNEGMIDHRTTLDFALKSILRFFMSGAKNDGEKKWLKNKALAIWGKLLSGVRVDVIDVKSLAVSRLAACFSDEKWMQFPGLNMIDTARIVDFLIRTNER